MVEHFLPGLIAHDPRDINKGDHLIKARNSAFNLDGLGIAWYTSSHSDFERGDTGESSDGARRDGSRPAAYKTIQPPLHDINLRSICRNTETRACFAHIRAASGTPIVNVNNHPFIFGRHTFMHNGVVDQFRFIKRALCSMLSEAAFQNINGGTDTEHVAALYMTFLTESAEDSVAAFEEEYSNEQMVQAMSRAIQAVIELQVRILGNTRKPNSLNLCTTDGVRLVACRFRNHAIQEPPSLYYSTKAGTTLNRKYPDNANNVDSPSRFSGKAESHHGKHLIVASEPSTYKAEDWHLIGKNQFIVVDANGEHSLKDVPCPEDWNARDDSD